MTLQPDMMTLHQAHSHFQQQHKQSLPTVEHDPAWPSPCEVGEPSKLNEIKWQAHARDPEGSLAALATALECRFPEGLDGFYGAFFAGNIMAFIEGKQIELLQAWNEEDFDRLQQNITGHILMKRRLKQPETVFIGLTEAEDLLLSVDVASGQVGLELVGKPQHHRLADSLAEFVTTLIDNYPS